MRNIVEYELYENSLKLNPDKMEFLEKNKVNWTYNEKTGLVDLKEFRINFHNLKNFKGISFGICEGDFDCTQNELPNLIGSPILVKGHFKCYKNKLRSLEGSPVTVMKEFDCAQNHLTSLQHSPKIVNGDFDCSYNSLSSLDGAPEKIGGNLKIEGNPLIKSPYKMFKMNVEGAIISDFGVFSKECVDLIRNELKKEKIFSKAILNSWYKLTDKEKKSLSKFLPNEGVGKTIKTVNKFGMNI